MYVIIIKREIDRRLGASAKSSAAVYANFVGFQLILFAVLREFGL